MNGDSYHVTSTEKGSMALYNKKRRILDIKYIT